MRAGCLTGLERKDENLKTGRKEAGNENGKEARREVRESREINETRS